jgi:hypothetical protein
MDKSRHDLNKSILLLAFSIVGIVMPLLGFLLTGIGLYYAHKPDINKYPSLGVKQFWTVLALWVAILIYVATSILWAVYFTQK